MRGTAYRGFVLCLALLDFLFFFFFFLEKTGNRGKRGARHAHLAAFGVASAVPPAVTAPVFGRLCTGTQHCTERCLKVWLLFQRLLQAAKAT